VADEIAVLSTTAMKTSFEELAPVFEHETRCRLRVALGPSSQIERRVAEGEVADMAITTRAGAEELIARGRAVADSVCDIARSFIGVCVAKDAPRPDLSSAESFRQAMLDAKSVALSKPVGGGASGAHMAKVFERLGIAAPMAGKSVYGAGGPAGLIGLIVKRGEAEIGIQQMAELLAVPNIEIVGTLPEALQSVTQFTAIVPTNAPHPKGGRAVLDFLRRRASQAVIKAKGLEPN
jgi:molybdate transport system substrate-binding protein